MEKKENRGGARTGSGRPKVEVKKLTRSKGFSTSFTENELKFINSVLKKVKGKNKSDKLLEIFEFFDEKNK
ncbi:MAG: hypothetical protein WBG30_08930 [Psychrilyobacter sp.]|uniref:hypothetical protein n=1 Tax=Psychrilyobacter sp. TaxID=2586924 RepID=UPI003C7571BD